MASSGVSGADSAGGASDPGSDDSRRGCPRYGVAVLVRVVARSRRGAVASMTPEIRDLLEAYERLIIDVQDDALAGQFPCPFCCGTIQCAAVMDRVSSEIALRAVRDALAKK